MGAGRNVGVGASRGDEAEVLKYHGDAQGKVEEGLGVTGLAV